MLSWRVDNHISTHQPPARIAEPTEHDIHRWRDLLTTAVPEARVTDPCWNLAWRHAAGGLNNGLDADAAVSYAAGRLATTRLETEPMEDHRISQRRST